MHNFVFKEYAYALGTFENKLEYTLNTYFHDVMFWWWDLAFSSNHWGYIWEHTDIRWLLSYLMYHGCSKQMFIGLNAMTCRAIHKTLHLKQVRKRYALELLVTVEGSEIYRIWVTSFKHGLLTHIDGSLSVPSLRLGSQISKVTIDVLIYFSLSFIFLILFLKTFTLRECVCCVYILMNRS